MPARVHVILVARSGPNARAQLLHTLEALDAQTVPAEGITLVVCGDASSARESEAISRRVEGIIQARSSTSFADAVALANTRVPAERAIWLLAHDTAPRPQALEQLAGMLERSPSAAIIAPKLVNADDDREIVSLGVTMTRFGRAVELAAGELDQGQHDGSDDVLGSDVRGVLIRPEIRGALTLDRALAGADEGLDLGVRARLGGGRVVLAPHARVGVRRDGPAALPAGRSRRAYVTRLAQLHRRLAYAPAPIVPLHWLSLLPLALWRSVVHLVGKRPEAVLPEWAAALTAMTRWRAVSRSRAAIRAFRSGSWASIAPLRVTRTQLHRRLDDGHGSEGAVSGELRFFTGGGAWAVLAALTVSIGAFASLLAWPVLGGGALLPLRQTVAGLWHDASWGLRGAGLDVVGPADPFAAVIAILGSLWPAAPSFALVLLWLLALPLAVLGAWFAATRVTDRSGLRIFAGAAWALAPTFLIALMEGRPAAVLVHLLLPWLFHSASVAHRSWGAAGAASLLLAALLACSPSLAAPLGVLWLVALAVALSRAHLRGAVRLLWVIVPTAALFLPVVVWQLRHGTPWALLGDPGLIWAGAQAGADAAGRLALATGFPTTDVGGWTSLLGASAANWMPLLYAPLAVLALAAALSPRWRAGVALLAVAVLGIGTAFFVVGVQVSFIQGTAVAIWPGAGLSVAWIGVVGAAAVTLDSGIVAPRLRAVATTTAALAIAVCAAPMLTALHADRSQLTDGPRSTLPAYVAAQADGDRELGTLVLTPQNDGGLAVDVVWGASDTLGAQTTMLSTATSPVGEDISALAVDLLSPRAFDAPADLAAHGISFVLLAHVSGAEADRARTFRTMAVAELNQRSGFVKTGETARGQLWRVETGALADRGEPTGIQQRSAQLVITLQLVTVLAALLLSVPTRASRRAARGKSRVVGRPADADLDLQRTDSSSEWPARAATPEASARVSRRSPATDADGQATPEAPPEAGADEPLPVAGAADMPPAEGSGAAGEPPAEHTTSETSSPPSTADEPEEER